MALHTRFAQFGLAAGVAMASTGAAAFTPVPDGLWEGTIKCDAMFQGAAVSKWGVTLPVEVSIHGPSGEVYNRFGGLYGTPAGWPVAYVGAYYPDFPGATKGKLGIATSPLVLEEIGWGLLPYGETGQLKLEMKKDGKVELKGESYVFAASPDGAVSSKCNWKLQKTNDTPIPSPFPLIL